MAMLLVLRIALSMVLKLDYCRLPRGSQTRVDFQESQDHALIAMQHSQILSIRRWSHVGRSWAIIDR